MIFLSIFNISSMIPEDRHRFKLSNCRNANIQVRMKEENFFFATDKAVCLGKLLDFSGEFVV